MNRTLDTKIFSLLLYRLSYLPTGTASVGAFAAVLIRTCPVFLLQQPPVRGCAPFLRMGAPVDRPPRVAYREDVGALYCLSAETRDSTKSITLVSRLTPSSRSISWIPVGEVTLTSVR